MAILSVINGYEVDVFTSEEHSHPAEVTEFPVEDGADVSDNIRSRPVTVTVEGYVSDTPIGRMAELRDSGSVPGNECYQRLLDVRESGEPVTLITSLGTFTNMALEDLSVPRSSDDGAGLRFSARFKQIKLAKNERSTIRVEVPRAQKKRNLGNKPSPVVAADDATVPKPPEKTESILHKLIF